MSVHNLKNDQSIKPYKANCEQRYKQWELLENDLPEFTEVKDGCALLLYHPPSRQLSHQLQETMFAVEMPAKQTLQVMYIH